MNQDTKSSRDSVERKHLKTATLSENSCSCTKGPLKTWKNRLSKDDHIYTFIDFYAEKNIMPRCLLQKDRLSRSLTILDSVQNLKLSLQFAK